MVAIDKGSSLATLSEEEIDNVRVGFPLTDGRGRWRIGLSNLG